MYCTKFSSTHYLDVIAGRVVVLVGGEGGWMEEEEEDSSGSSGSDCPAYPHTGGSAPSRPHHNPLCCSTLTKGSNRISPKKH